MGSGAGGSGGSGGGSNSGYGYAFGSPSNPAGPSNSAGPSSFGRGGGITTPPDGTGKKKKTDPNQDIIPPGAIPTDNTAAVLNAAQKKRMLDAARFGIARTYTSGGFSGDSSQANVFKNSLF